MNVDLIKFSGIPGQLGIIPQLNNSNSSNNNNMSPNTILNNNVNVISSVNSSNNSNKTNHNTLSSIMKEVDGYLKITPINNNIVLDLTSKIEIKEENKEYDLNTIFENDNLSKTSVTSPKSNDNEFLNKKRNPEILIENIIDKSENDSPSVSPSHSPLYKSNSNTNYEVINLMSPEIERNKTNEKNEYINKKHDEELIKEYKSVFSNLDSKSGFRVSVSSNINMLELYDWKVFEKLKKCK